MNAKILNLAENKGMRAPSFFVDEMSKEHGLDVINVYDKIDMIKSYIDNGEPFDAEVAGIEGVDKLIVVYPVTYNSMNGAGKLFLEALRFDAVLGKDALIVAVGGSNRSTLSVEMTAMPTLRSMGFNVSNDYCFINSSFKRYSVEDVVQRERLFRLVDWFVKK